MEMEEMVQMSKFIVLKQGYHAPMLFLDGTRANAPMILGTLSVVEMGLAALGLPHGKGGAQAAVEYLAKAVPA